MKSIKPERKRLRLNEDEKCVYDGLVAIGNGILSLEDAITRIKNWQNQLVRVVAAYSERIDEFDAEALNRDAYNIQTYGEDLICTIQSILNPEYEDWASGLELENKNAKTTI